MPGGNGTGPVGRGPMTGRGLGFCAGSTADYANFVVGRGCGRGLGRGLGRARGGYGFRAFNQVSPQQDLDSLKNQAQNLEDALNGIKNRIAELTDKG